MANETKHTPGPWPLEYTGDSKRILVGKGLVEGPGGYEIAEVYSDDCPGELAWANANLIGAAPDLLAELKAMTAKFTNCARSSGSDQWAIDEATAPANAAIARAEGHGP